MGVLFIALIYMYGRCIGLGFRNAKNVIFADFLNFPPIVSSQFYALESIGTLMCVRSTMKRRSQAKQVITATMLVGGGLFVLNGIMFYLSFYSPKELPFWYFAGEPVVRGLEILFYCFCPSTVIINHVANLCILEEISFVKKAIRSEIDEEDYDYFRLFVFRLSATIICFFPMFFGIFN